MPAGSVLARAVITRPAPGPATAGLAPLAGYVLFPPGQAPRHHPDGGAAIAYNRAASGRRQGPMARMPGDLGPAHRHGRTSLASPRAVSAGCSRLIRTVWPVFVLATGIRPAPATARLSPSERHPTYAFTQVSGRPVALVFIFVPGGRAVRVGVVMRGRDRANAASAGLSPRRSGRSRRRRAAPRRRAVRRLRR